MQNWVANIILKEKTGLPDASIMAMTVPQRVMDNVQDDFIFFLKGVLTFFILVMYIPPVYRTVYRIVAEKESRVKESMKMMGLSDCAYWMSWFTYYTIVNTLISTAVSVILAQWVMPRTQFWILFTAIWLYGQSLFGLIMIIQSLFVRARAAAISTSLIYFTTTLLQPFVRESIFPDKTTQYWCSLSPTVAMIQTFQCLATFEASRVGNNSDNIWSQFRNFSVGEGLCFMALDLVILLLLGLYAEQVLPKTYGFRRSICFCFQKSYWSSNVCCSSKPQIQLPKKLNSDRESSYNAINQTERFETQTLDPLCYERITLQQAARDSNKRVLTITDLHKKFDNGCVAVDGLNLKMFQD